MQSAVMRTPAYICVPRGVFFYIFFTNLFGSYNNNRTLMVLHSKMTNEKKENVEKIWKDEVNDKINQRVNNE